MIVIKAYFHVLAIFKIILYKLLFGKRLRIGKQTSFRKGFTIAIEGNGEIRIGRRCFFNNYCSISSLEMITIGNDCIFGEGVRIYDHNHKHIITEGVFSAQGYTKKPVVIGNNCWIGSNVIILKGVQIGENTVIGAGCVVYENIPPNSLVVNNTRGSSHILFS